MPIQKAEALFNFQPTAEVELQMKVSLTAVANGTWVRARDAISLP